MLDQRFFEIVDRLHDMPSPDGMTDLLAAFAGAYGLHHAVYLGVNLRRPRAEFPFVAYTYPATWATHYRAQNYIAADPLVEAATSSIIPIDWSDLTGLRPLQRRMMGEARSFGLGTRGLSLSTRGRGGETGMVSITMIETERAWSAWKRTEVGTLQVIAAHMHQAVLRMMGEPAPDVHLTTRERDCLRWAAEGKTFDEVGIILGIGSRTVRTYLETARHKLGAVNTVHAIAKAVSHNLIPHPSD